MTDDEFFAEEEKYEMEELNEMIKFKNFILKKSNTIKKVFDVIENNKKEKENSYSTTELTKLLEIHGPYMLQILRIMEELGLLKNVSDNKRGEWMLNNE